MSRVTVSVPASAEFVRIIRSVVSSVAARLRFGYEQIDDLRLAVDEACAHLLAEKPAASELTVTIRMDGSVLEVVASRDAPADTWPPVGARRTLAWQVLNALTDEASFERTDAGPAIQFRKRAPEPARR